MVLMALATFSGWPCFLSASLNSAVLL